MLRRIGISIAFCLPIFFVFRQLFLPGPLAWGDAPHFYPEEALELFSEPSAWTERGRVLGGVNQFQWLSPILFMWGVFAKIGLSNNLIIRLLFYFPALISACVGPFLLTRHLRQSAVVGFFSSFFYALNSYFVLLVDGGVVGVALAYGLFPLTILLFRKLFDSPSRARFWAALAVGFAITLADPRIAVICFLSFLVWVVIESVVSGEISRLVGLRYFVLLIVALLSLSMYWLIPLFELNEVGIDLEVSKLVQVNWRNALTLFAPHWPGNVFGKTSLPPGHYYLLPILVVFGVLLSKKWSYLVTFLIFVLLSLGVLPLDKIPYGFAFRDSTKFFIPSILFAGMLIGLAAERLYSRSRVFLGLFYFYLLLLVSIALLGRMNFVLSIRNVEDQFFKVYERLRHDRKDFRTAWFPERHPLAYATRNRPALDAKELVNLRPLARLNGGTYDRFNYLLNPEALEWYRTFGIKYLIFSGNPRVVRLEGDEAINWDDLNQRVSTASGLTKLDWGTDFAVYENGVVYPLFYSLSRLVAVVGPELNSARFPKLPSVYFEDGKLDPENLLGLPKDALMIAFNGKDEIDLQMSFLQRYFQGIEEARVSQWASYSANDYLLYKYQLAIRGVNFKDFDYQKGIALSTIGGEKLVLNFSVPISGEYQIGIRGMRGRGAGTLEVKVDGNGENFYLPQENLGWLVFKRGLSRGKHELLVNNTSGLQVVNVFAVIPQDKWREAVDKSVTFVNHFSVVGGEELKESDFAWRPVEFEYSGASRYKLANLADDRWIVLNGSFHRYWGLKKGQFSGNPDSKSLPLFSTVNVFYKNSEWESAEVVFTGQRAVRWGIYFSLLSVLVLGIVFLLQ